MAASIQTAGLDTAPRIPPERPACAADSELSSYSSHCRSASEIKVAELGAGANYFKTIHPKISAGTLSRTKSHCQPAMPRYPSMPRISSDTGPPTTEETGIARKNVLTARTR